MVKPVVRITAAELNAQIVQADKPVINNHGPAKQMNALHPA